MTVNVKTRYTKDGSRNLKQGGTTSRIPVKKQKEERLKIKKEENRKEGQEAARILNEQLQIKKEKELEDTRSKIKNAKDLSFDRDLFIQRYHFTLKEMRDKYYPNLDAWEGEQSPFGKFFDEESDQCKDTTEYKSKNMPVHETQCWKEKDKLMNKYDEYRKEDSDQKYQRKKDKMLEDKGFTRDYGTDSTDPI